MTVVEHRPGVRRSTPGLCRPPDLGGFRRGDERLLDSLLELRPAKRFHHVPDRAEGTGVGGRAVDGHTKDRQLREPPPHSAGEPHARTRCRFQQQQIRLLAVDPLAGPDGGVTEPKAQELEERPGRGVGIDDEDGCHG